MNTTILVWNIQVFGESKATRTERPSKVARLLEENASVQSQQSTLLNIAKVMLNANQGNAPDIIGVIEIVASKADLVLTSLNAQLTELASKSGGNPFPKIVPNVVPQQRQDHMDSTIYISDNGLYTDRAQMSDVGEKEGFAFLFKNSSLVNTAYQIPPINPAQIPPDQQSFANAVPASFCVRTVNSQWAGFPHFYNRPPFCILLTSSQAQSPVPLILFHAPFQDKTPKITPLQKMAPILNACNTIGNTHDLDTIQFPGSPPTPYTIQKAIVSGDFNINQVAVNFSNPCPTSNDDTEWTYRGFKQLADKGFTPQLTYTADLSTATSLSTVSLNNLFIHSTDCRAYTYDNFWLKGITGATTSVIDLVAWFRDDQLWFNNQREDIKKLRAALVASGITNFDHLNPQLLTEQQKQFLYQLYDLCLTCARKLSDHLPVLLNVNL